MNILEKIKSFFPFLRQSQSCGMVLSKDEHKGGTQADGSLSTQYCSSCYWNGQFIHPNATQEQVLERFQTGLRMRGMPERAVSYLVKKMQKEMPTLKRWKQK